MSSLGTVLLKKSFLEQFLHCLQIVKLAAVSQSKAAGARFHPWTRQLAP